MKKLLWMLLAALPMQAVANDDDPIAYKCYYCTPDEMEAVALAQGIGQHYVYDAKKLTISGYNVLMDDGLLKAQPFTAESWLEAQFLGMMALYDPHDGEMKHEIRYVALLAPDSEHGRDRTNRYIWGQHLTALNPNHVEARERVRRFLTEHKDLSFLDTSLSEGKLLRLKYTLEGDHPIRVAMNFAGRIDSIAAYYFDHGARRWNYGFSLLPQGGYPQPIQEATEDFAPEEGSNRFKYESGEKSWSEAFMERAAWAGVPVVGEVPSYGNTHFECTRSADNVQCHVK